MRPNFRSLASPVALRVGSAFAPTVFTRPAASRSARQACGPADKRGPHLQTATAGVTQHPILRLHGGVPGLGLIYHNRKPGAQLVCNCRCGVVGFCHHVVHAAS
ncbi:hypothetical protein ZHAS_00021091 [Anopheles sinensis]|uniref:Uncharacterized protein n=1 Tax=Anopheles sinensis TaxID=74873 RepID=A0A084WRH5_ANOSI|nr:hypothetical protein ZHAS_00021091 [Anopheles sinensis]